MSTAPPPELNRPPGRRVLVLLVLASLAASWIASVEGRKAADAERRAEAAAAARGSSGGSAGAPESGRQAAPYRNSRWPIRDSRFQ